MPEETQETAVKVTPKPKRVRKPKPPTMKKVPRQAVPAAAPEPKAKKPGPKKGAKKKAKKQNPGSGKNNVNKILKPLRELRLKALAKVAVIDEQIELLTKVVLES